MLAVTLRAEYIVQEEYFTFYYTNQSMKQLHREDGPAIEGYPSMIVLSDVYFTQQWFVKGKRHRTDGPAIVNLKVDGSAEYAWWLNGKEYTEEEFNSIGSGKGRGNK